MPPDLQTPCYYIFVTGDIEWEPFSSGMEVTQSLAANNIWLVSKVTPFKKIYKQGDRILFYVSGPKARYFIGDAVIAGEVQESNKADLELANKLGLQGFTERLPLKDVKIWAEKLPIKPLIMNLDFIKDKKNYGLHFRQASTRVPADDYQFLLEKAGELAAP